MGIKKSPEEVGQMREGAKLLARCLDMLVAASLPGVSPKRIDTLADQFIRDHGAIPAFKGYGPEAKPFPASVCFSKNLVLVHGIPYAGDVIREGDIITIDCGLSLNGWFSDAARLFGVGQISQEDASLIESCKSALSAGVAACLPGKKLGDVSAAIQRSIVASNFYNVYQFCGHGIGRKMHEEPQVPNFGKKGTGITLEPGMIFCIEPMLLKNKSTKLGVLSDGWTIVSTDQSNTAHVEHMVLITEGSAEILTD